MTVEEQLQREAAGRRLAVIGAIAGALLPLAGSLFRTLVYIDAPKNRVGQLLFADEHASDIVISALVLGLGALALTLPLRYLYDAVKFRRPELPPVARICALAGPGIYFVAQLVLAVVLITQASAFASGGVQTFDRAEDLTGSPVIVAASAVGLAAQLALGFAFVMICLNAMRAGLLTRFMGVLGIITGILFVVPLGSPLPVVQTFWLIALAFLLGGRWPQGGPPAAWRTGQAEPWPTQQQLREAREEGVARHRGDPVPEPDSEPEPEDGESARPAHPVSKKRKRKKRR